MDRREAREVDPRIAPDRTPWSIRAWMSAIVSDMKRWEDGGRWPDGPPPDS